MRSRSMGSISSSSTCPVDTFIVTFDATRSARRPGSSTPETTSISSGDCSLPACENLVRSSRTARMSASASGAPGGSCGSSTRSTVTV